MAIYGSTQDVLLDILIEICLLRGCGVFVREQSFLCHPRYVTHCRHHGDLLFSEQDSQGLTPSRVLFCHGGTSVLSSLPRWQWGTLETRFLVMFCKPKNEFYSCRLPRGENGHAWEECRSCKSLWGWQPSCLRRASGSCSSCRGSRLNFQNPNGDTQSSVSQVQGT